MKKYIILSLLALVGCDKAAESRAEAIKYCEQAKGALVVAKENQAKLCVPGIELPAQAKDVCSSQALVDLEKQVSAACGIVETLK